MDIAWLCGREARGDSRESSDDTFMRFAFLAAVHAMRSIGMVIKDGHTVIGVTLRRPPSFNGEWMSR